MGGWRWWWGGGGGGGGGGFRFRPHGTIKAETDAAAEGGDQDHREELHRLKVREVVRW